MYPALIKRQLIRPSAFRVTRVAQASLHEKSQPVKGNEECTFANARLHAEYSADPLLF